ncbi:two-component system OmpR family sensor kinase [Catenuloplanes nepalensis]|uniref:histidine kinase n=1 Tax=Catenuloplanes nepalensis TaxID=587533 RepID=A0ABT9N5S7_9ACTN|nr:HAMP domain-containing sensor histidine kinase [Catenuloplanes nepalensis]MDP9799048.1 two-component system OmpR family sensor kinase [Catenuloplanes nepalensis]
MSSSRRTDSRPRGPRGWPLRTRLVATMLALLAAACLLISVVTELALHRNLQDQLDRQLNTAAQRVEIFERPGSGPDQWIGRGQPAGTLVAYLSGDRPGVRILGTDLQEIDAGGALYAMLGTIPADGRPRTYHLEGYGNYRLKAQRQGPHDDLVVTGLPTAQVESTQVQVAVILAVVTGGALVIAGVAGVVIIRRALRPLRRVAATAGRVAELELDRGEVALAERLPDEFTDPRTEVGQVGAALNRMLGNVEAALAARHASETQVRQFVADASHELRTPLAAIRGYAELTRRSRQEVPPEVAHVLTRVESEAKRMTLLVEDMLLLARLDAGRPLAHEPVDLAMLAVDTVSDAHAAGPRHVWRLDLPPEDSLVEVLGDRARLHQVLANLLANARTHTPPGTEVTVSVQRRDGRAAVLVADTGPGIPADLLPHVFERFARGDSSRSRAAGSTGLGLAIVHAVVTAHGGRIDVRSRPGRTEFLVSMPLTAGAIPAGA